MHLRQLQSSPALPYVVRVFWVVNALLTLLCGVALDFSREILGLGYPYSSPYFPFNQYVDLFDFRARFYHFHHLDFFSTAHSRGSIFSYPAPMGMLYALFLWPDKHIHLIFAACTTLPIAALLYLMGHAMVRRGVSWKIAAAFLLSTCLMAYPFWFNYFLANLEICIFLLLTAGVIAFLRHRHYTAAVLIGLSGSMKLFPFILLGLLFSRRQYRAIAVSLIVAAAAFVGSIWMECPNFAVARAGMATGAQAMNDGLIRKWLPLESGFDHSFFGLLKRPIHGFFPHATLPATYLTAYVVLAAISGLILYFRHLRKLPFLNQVLGLYVAAVSLPPMSHHYTLLHLYVPWALLVLFAIDAAREGRHVPGLLVAFVCFAVLFSPESEFIWRSATFSGQIKAVFLMGLWYVSVHFPFHSATWDEGLPTQRRARSQSMSSVRPLTA